MALEGRDTPKDLDWTLVQQARASRPDASAWVAANAGSGKTHVLAQRVVRLLLAGARPSSILCLTYTRAAASEMANRVFARLASWARMDDGALRDELRALEGVKPDAIHLAEARRLFARALETPGGLKVQTIHAFCEAVLHQFPLEANVAGHFSILTDSEASILLAEARRSLLGDAFVAADIELAGAFDTVLDAAGEDGVSKILDEIVKRRSALSSFFSAADARGGPAALLHEASGIARSQTQEAIREACWPLPSMPAEAIARFEAAAAKQTAKTPKTHASNLREAATLDGEARWQKLCEIYLTQDGAPRSLRNVVNDATAIAMPDAEDRVAQAQAHIAEIADLLATRRMVDLTQSLLVLARRLLADYERLKRQRGRLDFDDLVTRAAALLARGGGSAWVHYKLDGGIDHVLVDEGQDTSPPQWSIIGGLTEEFFAGETARSRTIFAVGDEKQSIYSFQGARPERFREEERRYARLARDVSAPFEAVELRLSFRSAREVLEAVDHVFEHEQNRKGLGAPDALVVHASNRGMEPGRVDVWDMIAATRQDGDEDWTAPFDATPESDPKAQLARRVAATIREWLETDRLVEKGKSRPMTPGDIIVLVRKRDAFVSALGRELKREPTVPVAGADRLRLTDHIAVKDLMALGRVMELPEDDLSLAALLKSPLFDLGEDALFTLCNERGKDETVMAHLRRLAEAGIEPFAGAAEELARLSRRHADLSVHDFFADLLAPGGGRAAFLARLGSEAADVLDEFLAFALDHERSGLPGMRAFLAVLESQSPEVKRELEQGRDEVRIMTVHAAKGLEAPAVFLVDSGGSAAVTQHMPKLRYAAASPDGRLPPVPFWISGGENENRLSLALKRDQEEAMEDEYRRLLYVGMTRAADRLVVCGYHGLQPPKAPNWHTMVAEALGSRGAEATEFSAGGIAWPGFTYRRTGEDARFPAAEPDAGPPEADLDVDALRALLPAPVRPPRPLVPSGTRAIIDGGIEGVRGQSLLSETGGANAGHALERGRIVHRLLQVLPALPEADRQAAMRRYLDGAAADWPAELRETTAERIVAIMDDPQLREVFSAESEAEVAVMGTVRVGGRDFTVSGRIDRIAAGPQSVLIVDYKTTRPACRTAQEVPQDHRAQMALYRALLQPLYPDRPIRAALVYTEAPAMIELAEGELDRAIAALATK